MDEANNVEYYLIFDDSGQILSIGHGPSGIGELNSGPGRNLLIATAEVGRHYIKYPATSPTLAEFPPCPSAYHEWDYPTGQWVGRADAAELRRAENNAAIASQLAAIDAQKIRAISDAVLDGDHTRLNDLETTAAALRALWQP